MKALYAPYILEYDEETRMPVLSALAQDGSVLAVASEPGVEAAEAELVSLVMTVLDEMAQDGRDPFPDLLDAPPADGGYVTFLPSELVTIHLKLARARAKLRQVDMAERMGITQQAYAKLERRGANLTLNTLIQLERVLGCELVAWPRSSGPTKPLPGPTGRTEGKLRNSLNVSQS
jgi:DNA-binding XRE family transcriptional regulator